LGFRKTPKGRTHDESGWRVFPPSPHNKWEGPFIFTRDVSSFLSAQSAASINSRFTEDR
jgi:hypothetical protein